MLHREAVGSSGNGEFLFLHEGLEVGPDQPRGVRLLGSVPHEGVGRRNREHEASEALETLIRTASGPPALASRCLFPGDRIAREKVDVVVSASRVAGPLTSMLSEMLVHLEHGHFVLAKDLPELVFHRLSISAEARPGISVQSRPTPMVEERSSPESTEGTRARRAVPPRATERRAWGGAVGPRGRSAGHGSQVRFLKRQLSLPVSRMSQWCVRRSSSAVVILASAKTRGHSAKARLVDRTIEVRS